MAELRWTQAQIHRALGAAASAVFPQFGQLAKLTVHIPRYKLIALRDEARCRRMDVSELVSDDISVFREVAERLEQRAPGYMDAWHFPYRHE